MISQIRIKSADNTELIKKDSWSKSNIMSTDWGKIVSE